MVMQQNDRNTATRDAFSQGVDRRLARLRALARLFSVLGVLLLAALAVVAVAASVAPRLMGLQSYAIISGSMEPALPTGSLVYAQPVAASELQPGDVAAYRRDQDVIVHRVQTNDVADEELTTKGDANADADVRPVPYAHVLGRVTASVPGIGYFLMVLQSTPGKLLLAWIVLMGAAFCIVGSVLGNLARSRSSSP